MTILIATEFGTRELIGEELEDYLTAKAVSETEALQRFGNEMREQRNNILMRCDWVELPSAIARLSTEQLSLWETYRQALRDVPSQEGFPWNITWPVQPE